MIFEYLFCYNCLEDKNGTYYSHTLRQTDVTLNKQKPKTLKY